jgi:hypothetical protein
MKRKIVDIAPPGKFKKTALPPDSGGGERRKNKFLPFLFFLVLLLALGGAVYFASPLYSKLALSITPEVKEEVFEIEVQSDTKQAGIDFDNNIVPGKIFEIEKSMQKTFKATGSDYLEGKAEGTIKVYNSRTPPKAITLREKTRFLSSEGGKIFRTPEKVYLPPAKIINGKVVPSMKEIRVVAEESGEEYNIGPSKFSVPGLAGSSFYYSIWAESESQMSGGFKREVKKVLPEDISLSKNVLLEELKKTAKASLKSQLPKDFAIPENAFAVEDFNFSCSSKPGDIKESFNCEGKIKAKLMAVDAGALRKLALRYLDSVLPSNKEFDPRSLSLTYVSKSFLEEQGKMVMTVKIRLNTYAKIPVDVIRGRIVKKTDAEIWDILTKTYPQIKEIKFKFWPFWVKKAPPASQRIKISIAPPLEN